MLEGYMRTPKFDPFGSKHAYLEENKNKCDVLIIGSSHAWAGLNPEWISPNAINIANAFQPLFYDYKILERYISEMDALEVVILPMSYTTFFNLPSAYHQDMYAVYWGFPVYGEKKLENYSLVLSLGIKSLFDRIINQEDNYQNKGWKEFTGNLDASPERTAKRVEMMHDVMSMDNWKENTSYFENIIRICRDHKKKVFLFYPPYTIELNQQIGASPYLLKMKSYLSGMEKQNGVVLYDFNDNEQYPDSLFMDADHLNRSGAKKLSDSVRQLISEWP